MTLVTKKCEDCYAHYEEDPLHPKHHACDGFMKFLVKGHKAKKFSQKVIEDWHKKNVGKLNPKKIKLK